MNERPNGGWHSEAFPASGGMAGEGIANQLGRPQMSPVAVFVRETVQNTWDARLADVGVRYSLLLRNLDRETLGHFREELLRDAPHPEHLPLAEVLERDRLRVLFVADRGTTGLGGPTRADQPSARRRDFVAFVRNVGDPPDHPSGGGTFGYGKTVFFNAGGAHTMLVDTRCEVDGHTERRFIGAALGPHHVRERAGRDVLCTGRHWWGDVQGDLVEPFRGTYAESLASTLGFPAFGPGEQGTTVAVLDPFPSLDDDVLLRRLVRAMLWHAWPKMLSGPGAMPPVIFHVERDETVVPIPDPEHTAPFDLFTTAYRRQQTGEGETLRCRRPGMDLGSLTLYRRLRRPHDLPEDEVEEEVIQGQVHHVALMRGPELIVRYLEARTPTGAETEYGGVFRGNAQLEEVFKTAEPPTHDDWVPDGLDSPAKTFVRTTMRTIETACRRFVLPEEGAPAPSVQLPMAAFSSSLAGLIAAQPGTGPSSGGSAGSGARGGRGGGGGAGGGGGIGPGSDTFRIRLVGAPTLELHDGRPVLRQRFRAEGPGEHPVRADLGVGVDEGGRREQEPPAGARMPTVVGWLIGDHELTGESITLDFRTDSEHAVLVEPAPDALTIVTVRLDGPH